jgi:hypothetical protein
VVQLFEGLLAKVNDLITFLSLYHGEELGQKARHAADDVDGGTRVQLVNPLNQHHGRVIVFTCLKLVAHRVNEPIQVEHNIPAKVTVKAEGMINGLTSWLNMRRRCL